jgi:hypothetical protein
MDWTLALAVWGAASGTIATVATLLTVYRDRAILIVRQDSYISPGQRDGGGAKLGLRLVISNEGRQPITVHRAGFATEWIQVGHRWSFKWKPSPTDVVGNDEQDFPVRLQPGEPLVMRYTVDDSDEIDLDRPHRGFAETRKELIWADPFSRWLLEFKFRHMGWLPEKPPAGSGNGEPRSEPTD